MRDSLARDRTVPAVSHLRRALGGTRTRILAAFIVLMAFSTAVSVIAIYEVLAVRADDRLDASLRQEVDEFRRSPSQGIDPRPASRSANELDRIFEVYKSRNVAATGELVVMFEDGRFFDTLSSGTGGRFSLTTSTAAGRG